MLDQINGVITEHFGDGWTVANVAGFRPESGQAWGLVLNAAPDCRDMERIREVAGYVLKMCPGISMVFHGERAFSRMNLRIQG